MSFLNAFMSVTCVCEKLGRHEEALLYSTAGAEPDLSKGGTPQPMMRLTFMLIQGRSYAGLGRVADAARSFEAVAEEGHRVGLVLLVALALRDLKLSVLDPLGHNEHGSRRLGAALRLLKGPAELLTPMLKGLDAADLMTLPPPESSYEVIYAQEDPAVDELRRELQGLRLMALQSRALADGLARDKVALAVDSDDPKSALLKILLEFHASKLLSGLDAEPTLSLASHQYTEVENSQQHQTHNAALRSELTGLTPSQLRKRAVAEGIADMLIETAEDADSPKKEMIGLILATASRANFERKEKRALRTELERMAPSQLRKRAVAEGIADTLIETAEDADSPKKEMIELILAAA